MDNVLRVPVETEIDVVTARLRGSELAQKLGFSSRETYAIAIAISEVARNIVRYAHHGRITFSEIHRGSRMGLSIVAEDEGPGIPDLNRAMEPGFSTGNSLGLGLNSAERQMDEFEIVSTLGDGTTVTMTKWRRRK
ncbi:MAG TPA: anti-sigma regulatory factor [Rhodocyclaceae bacterium]|nr:anti-sigma regulatory factor [Rhodocyclaceae bacterium]